jgi:hypothetical protein
VSRAILFGLVAAAANAGTAPAERVPTPRPEACKTFDADPAEGTIAAASGLSYAQVRTSLNSVIQYALYCRQPEGLEAVHLTFELLVGCDGLVSSVEVADDGGAPAAYVHCVSSVIAKADFPAHDLPEGMSVTYPVDVSW